MRLGLEGDSRGKRQTSGTATLRDEVVRKEPRPGNLRKGLGRSEPDLGRGWAEWREPEWKGRGASGSGWTCRRGGETLRKGFWGRTLARRRVLSQKLQSPEDE